MNGYPLVSLLLEEVSHECSPAEAIVRLRQKMSRWRKKVARFHKKLESPKSVTELAAIKRQLDDEFLPYYKRYKADPPDQRRFVRLLSEAGALASLYKTSLKVFEGGAVFLDYIGVSRVLSPFHSILRKADRRKPNYQMLLAKLGWSRD